MLRLNSGIAFKMFLYSLYGIKTSINGAPSSPPLRSNNGLMTVREPNIGINIATVSSTNPRCYCGGGGMLLSGTLVNNGDALAMILGH